MSNWTKFDSVRPPIGSDRRVPVMMIKVLLLWRVDRGWLTGSERRGEEAAESCLPACLDHWSEKPLHMHLPHAPTFSLLLPRRILSSSYSLLLYITHLMPCFSYCFPGALYLYRKKEREKKTIERAVRVFFLLLLPSLSSLVRRRRRDMCVDGGKREKEMMEEIVATVRYRPKASRQNCAQPVPFGYLPYLIASALLL